MYLYEIFSSNPEGIDWMIRLQHKEKFSEEKFQEICEEAFVDALKKQYEEKGMTFISSIDTDYLLKCMEEKGFVPGYDITSYGIEPYWGRESIKNEELIKLLNKKDKDEDEL